MFDSYRTLWPIVKGAKNSQKTRFSLIPHCELTCVSCQQKQKTPRHVAIQFVLSNFAIEIKQISRRFKEKCTFTKLTNFFFDFSFSQLNPSAINKWTSFFSWSYCDQKNWKLCVSKCLITSKSDYLFENKPWRVGSGTCLERSQTEHEKLFWSLFFDRVKDVHVNDKFEMLNKSLICWRLH